MEYSEPQDVAALTKGLRAGGTFEYDLSSTRFTVTTCPVPELNFTVAALT